MIRRLILGGARSGKSRFAESLMASHEVDYIATAPPRPDDPEWVERVEAHQRRRPATWETIETISLDGELARDSHRIMLVDCLTLWLTAHMDELGCWDRDAEALAALEQRIESLTQHVSSTTRSVTMVSNELGLSVVPESASGRLFRDYMGIVNASIASVCDEVWFCIAGIPHRIA